MENIKIEDIKIEDIKPDIKQQPKKRSSAKKRMFFIAFGVLLAMTLFIARPAFIGYSVYGDVKKTGLGVDAYKTDLQTIGGQLDTTKDALVSCEQEKTASAAELSTLDAKVEDITNELEDQQKLVEKKDEKITELETAVSEEKAKSDELEKSYEDLLKSSARSICCKQKIDNENINFFKVEDGKIVCTEEEGEELKCW